MPATIILIHGYSGSPDTLASLAESLDRRFGSKSAVLVSLPGHGPDMVPSFDRSEFVRSVLAAITAPDRGQGKLVLFAHSTGGSLALAALAESGVVPDLLILASVPHRIDAAYLERWKRHRSGRTEIPFTAVANMISLVNEAGSLRFDHPFPVVLLQGAQDELVPAESASGWQEGVFAGPTRTVIIPDGTHDLFSGPNSRLVIDAVITAIEDGVRTPAPEDRRVIEHVATVEPEVLSFLEHSPQSFRHLAACPSALAAAGCAPRLSPRAETAPVLANIEITTRCNLRCTYCARTLRGVAPEEMSLDTFKMLLSLLPHAYRITLVGLGETLMHDKVADFVAHAASAGRRVALVTNAMLLDESLSRELLKAGLSSIAFSLDAAAQQAATDLRPGTDLGRVTDNIRRFVELSRPGRPVSTAVFSAVSAQSLAGFEQLVDLAASLGVHVMMASDLNFRENTGRTLWKNSTAETAGLVRSAVTAALKRKFPILSVRGLEEFGLWKRYDRFLLIPPEQLYQRSEQRTWCCSPWQTIVVTVRGDVTVCDCRPEAIAGSLLERPLSEIWNSDAFVVHRKRMLSDDPPEACRICPRF